MTIVMSKTFTSQRLQIEAESVVEAARELLSDERITRLQSRGRGASQSDAYRTHHEGGSIVESHVGTMFVWSAK